MRVSIDFRDVEKFTDKMRRFLLGWDEAERDLLQTAADMMLEKVRALAPYRTGVYRMSWQIQASGRGYLIFTNHPAARRLEYGFVGTDSLGRNYNQAPRPHMRPAVTEVREWLYTEYAKLPRGLWRNT